MIDRLFTILRAHVSTWARGRSGQTNADRDSWRTAEEGRESFDDRHESAASSSQPHDQVTEDLAIFGLTPPSSFAQVRAARNREMQRYHPDRFGQDPEKAAAANEVAQIYNAAFERLKRHYGA